MAKIESGGMLDPVQVGEVAMKRRTKGTPFTNGGTGTELNLNVMPPGLDFSNQPTDMDGQRIAKITPIGPIIR